MNKIMLSGLLCASIISYPLDSVADATGQMLQLEPSPIMDVDELVSSQLVRAFEQQSVVLETNKEQPTTSEPTSAESLEPAPNGPGCDVAPASAGVGADVAETYFGPPPSTVNPSLVGPVELLTAGEIDRRNLTVELPLYRGQMSDGRNIFPD